MMVRFEDYDQVLVLTHERTETPTLHRVGHLDDWMIRVAAAYLDWKSRRVVADAFDGSEMLAGALNVICDFQPKISVTRAPYIIFDHHDPATNDGRCSVHKLADELVSQGLLREVPALMSQISLWDVVGPQAIPPQDRPDPDQYTAILAAEPENGFDFKTASFILTMLERSFSIRQFINELYRSETSLGERARQIHKEILARREEALAGILAGVVVKTSPSGVRYVTIDKNPAGMTSEIFSRLKVDLIVHPNERTKGAVSIVRDSDGRYGSIPVSDLVQIVPVVPADENEDEDTNRIVFCHPGGFLLVVKPPFSIL